MACVLRLFDVDLVNEWLRTCDEYSRNLARPFRRIPFGRLWSCQQADWSEAFTEWSIFQFHLSYILAIVGQVFLVIAGYSVVSAVINVIVYAAISYFYAHLGWFAVVKRRGCLFLGCCCFEGTLLLFVWGILCIVFGVARVLESIRVLEYTHDCSLCVVNTCLQCVYAVVMVYMGICCLRIWQQPMWWSREVPQPQQGATQGEVETAPPAQAMGKETEVSAKDDVEQGESAPADS